MNQIKSTDKSKAEITFSYHKKYGKEKGDKILLMIQDMKLTYQDIANEIGCTRQGASYVIKKYFPEYTRLVSNRTSIAKEAKISLAQNNPIYDNINFVISKAKEYNLNVDYSYYDKGICTRSLMINGHHCFVSLLHTKISKYCPNLSKVIIKDFKYSFYVFIIHGIFYIFSNDEVLLRRRMYLDIKGEGKYQKNINAWPRR